MPGTKSKPRNRGLGSLRLHCGPASIRTGVRVIGYRVVAEPGHPLTIKARIVQVGNEIMRRKSSGGSLALRPLVMGS